MQITEVRVFPVDEEKLKAYASIVLDACFIVNDLKVIEGKRGLFISMPSRRRKRGGYRDVAHPLNNETRRMIEEQVLAEYQRALGSAAAGVAGGVVVEADGLVALDAAEVTETVDVSALPLLQAARNSTTAGRARVGRMEPFTL